MIKSIHLHNFESHKNTKMVFSPGVNVISGISDHGKSSIIRGIYWVKDNKPSSNSMVSFWNRDKYNEPIKPTYVILSLGRVKVKREKSKEIKNGYQIDDNKPLEAIRSGVPEQVSDVLNILDLNVQYQFDRPFLISDSPQDVARFFNKIIKLDLIDKMQSKAERLRIEFNKTINNNQEQIDALKLKWKSFDWIEDAEEIIVKVEALESSIEEVSKKKNEIERLIENLDNCEIKIKNYKVWLGFEEKVKDIDNISKLIQEDISYLFKLIKLVNSITKIDADLQQYQKINNLKNEVERIEEVNSSIKEIDLSLNKLKKLLKSLDSVEKDLTRYEKELQKYVQEMPKNCPLCGKRLDE